MSANFFFLYWFFTSLGKPTFDIISFILGHFTLGRCPFYSQWSGKLTASLKMSIFEQLLKVVFFRLFVGKRSRRWGKIDDSHKGSYFQKIMMHLSFPQIDEPFIFLKIWIFGSLKTAKFIKIAFFRKYDLFWTFAVKQCHICPQLNKVF